MKHISLCTGIGACEMAATWMGWENVLSCEINPFCNRVLSYYYPRAYHHGDIKTLNYETIEKEVTERFGKDWRKEGVILTAGFPCQPFSSAGKQRGSEDHRYLWPEVLRIIQELRPDWFVGENVAGMLSMAMPGKEIEMGSYQDVTGENFTIYEKKERFIIDRLCSDLESVGYTVQPVIIPACAVGAPHRRDRIWFIAYDSCGRTEAKGRDCKVKSKKDPARRTQVSTKSVRLSGKWTTTDTNGHNCTSPRSRRETKTNRRTDHEKQDERGIWSERIDGLRRFLRDKTNGQKNLSAFWEGFPAESPICERNDGLPCELLGITFSGWLQKAIESLGNSMVPQVVYRLFKAIQTTDEFNA